MPLLITYDPSLVPDGGIEIASQVCAPIEGTTKEPAGSAFHQMAKIQVGELSWSPIDDDEDDMDDADSVSDDESSESSGDEEARPAGIPRPKAPKGKDGKKQEKKEDLYKLLGLENERWMATEKQIRDAYRKAALRMHPDKAVTMGVAKEDAEARFKALQEAYETLSDPVKRREFDSTDEFDDYLPSTCSAGDFFKVFGSAFKRQGKWSERKPVPDLGDEKTAWAKVQKFYDFWYRFKSWRVFPHPDEEDEEAAGSREERRWIQKHNQRLRAKAKKGETKRLRDFVDAAWNCDPRVAAAHQEKKQAREDRKQAKIAEKRAAEEAKRKAKEEEEARKRAEEEARAAEEEAEKARLKEERREMREHRAMVGKTCREQSLLGATDIAMLCESCSLAELREAAATLSAADLTSDDKKARITSLVEEVAARLRKEEEERLARVAIVEEKLAAEKAEAHRKKMADMGEWSEEELRLLEKAMKKYPIGTKQRWEQVAAYVRTRTPEEVVTMVKDHLAKGKLPANLVKDGIVIKDKYKDNLQIKSEASSRGQAFTDVAITDAAVREDLATPQAAVKVVSATSGAWSAAQERALVTAMKTFGKDVADRWDKIAVAVPGKSKAECFARFKELKEAHQAKKSTGDQGGRGGKEEGDQQGSGEWTQEQEQALVKMMKAVGKDVEDRWDKIAEGVPGKSKAECFARFKELKEAHQAKKQQKSGQ